MSPARPVLEVDGLGKGFGGKDVLKAAAFTAWSGRITALMGRNGAGKSTMLRIAAGRVRADYGRVVYKGDFVARPSLSRLARAGLMYSAQESALTPLFTIEDHFHAYLHVYGGEERLEQVMDALALGELFRRRPGRLSGGEKQRASLGLALVRSPDCLLMDEPFAGVAPRDRPIIAAGLRSLARKGTALVVSGHDVEDLFAVSDTVIWVVAGTTHWIGRPDEAARHEQFRREYLGPRGVDRVPPGEGKGPERTGGAGGRSGLRR